MNATPRSWFASLQAAFALLLLSLLLALPWSRLAYPRSNLERQGIDIVNHLIIAQQLTVPNGPSERVLGGQVHYPATSHRLIVWAAPLFGGHLLPAMRYVAAATMLALLLMPYVLLCRLFSPLPALVLLLAWHLICFYLKVDGVNHFMWEGQFNYSRAVGTVAFWLALVALSTRADTPLGRLALQGLAIACACFALACHIAPGAVTLAAVMAWQGACWLRQRRGELLLGVVGTVLAGGAMLLGTDVWVYMVQNAHDNGWLPVGNQYLLLLWVPILLAGLGLYAARLARAEVPTEPDGDNVETVLLAGILASGTLQAYLTCRMLASGTCAPYAIKSIYFFTFPAATLLLARWAGQLAGRRTWPAFPRHPAWLPGVLAIGLGVWLGVKMVRGDLGLRQQVHLGEGSDGLVPSPERLPDGVCRQLKGRTEELAGWYYFDPYQGCGSFYATLVNLDVRRDAAWRVQVVLAREEGTVTPAAQAELLREGVAGILLPGDIDPPRFAPGLVPVKVGGFWKCRMPSRVSAAGR